MHPPLPTKRRTSACACLLAFCCAAITEHVAADEPPPPTRPQKFSRDFQPFLKTYCYDCHSGAEAYAGLAMEKFESSRQIQKDADRWDQVVRVLRERAMPPEGEKQPGERERKAAGDFLEDLLADIDCELISHPGRVTMRRLNRIEYQNTIRDLVGVRVDATERFPADEVGYGFDNIGDVLSLPPLLMEKYLEAAEEIADKAIVTDGDRAPQTTRIAAGEIKAEGSQKKQGDHIFCYSWAKLQVPYRVTQPGEHTITVRAGGDQAGGEPCKMRLVIDGEEAAVLEVSAVRGDPQEYEHRQRLARGSRSIDIIFINDFYDPKLPPDRRDRNLIVHDVEIAQPQEAGSNEYPASHRRIFFEMPKDRVDENRAAKAILERFASRAFRRPVTPAELRRLVDLAGESRRSGSSFEEAIQHGVTAVLVSPHFLFKVEVNPRTFQQRSRGEVQSRLISEFELATRLSYFLWSSMPDDELLKLAWGGKLRANLDAQVRRMLADHRATALVDNFAVQWLQLRALDETQPDARRFPEFGDPLRGAMLTEAKLLFEHVMKSDRSVLEFIDADYTFVNDRLAKYYGIAGVEGREFRRVSLDRSPRGGVMTLGAVLTVTSNPMRTSPVKRGKWILDNLLGESPPDPPPNVPELSEEEHEITTASLRDRLAQHREDPTCAVCHNKMDALGLALENFDAIGRWREKDGRFKIDASGELPGGVRFSGPAELKKLLAKKARNKFVRCLTRRMLTYALGRGVERHDRCTVKEITRQLDENDYRFSVLVAQIVNSEPFQKLGPSAPASR